jgi:uncharacterized membrane protein YjfL (UPF0719 family)
MRMLAWAVVALAVIVVAYVVVPLVVEQVLKLRGGRQC